MKISVALIQELREKTGAGILDCKKALEDTQGDLEKAAEILRRKGLATAAKKAERVAQDGLIEAYIHPGARMGALVELNCETDFVARTKEFRELAHELAMQVVASRPRFLSPETIPADVLEQQKEAFRAQAQEGNKPPAVVEKIIQGKLDKYFDENCLLRQPYIRDENLTIQDVVKNCIARVGENIVVRRFARFELGEAE